MDRLTERDGYGNADIIGVDSMELQGNLDFDEFVRATNALNRLADYEDTGLSQEEIKTLGEKLKRSAVAIIEESNHQERMLKMLELERAEAEGRLIVLPCKVGDTVYQIIDDCTFPVDCATKRMCKGCEYRKLFVEKDAFHLCLLTDSGELQSGYYSTFEEAERALEEIK